MTESQIQKEIIDYLRKKDYIVFRLNSGRAKNNVKLCPPGTPDLLAVGKNKTFWVEVKTREGKLRDSQQSMIMELHERKHKVIIAYSVKDLELIL